MKKLLFIIILLFLIICSFLYPEVAVNASRQGILTWFNQLLPSLFAFTILSGILLRSKFIESLGQNSNLVAIVFTLICGFTFGFPIGAKLAADFYSHDMLTRKQSTILAIAVNNFSNMYVCGYVMPTLFPDEDFQMATYLVLYILPLIIGVISLLFTHEKLDTSSQKKTASRFQLDMQIIDAGIISGFESLIKICGYVVMFSLISHMISHLIPVTSTFTVILLGNLEITNGIQILSNYTHPSKYIFAMQLLSFGGLSGLAQTASILKSSGLSVKYYAIGKTLLSGLSILLLFLCRNIYH